jgi:hypothetical protein
MKTKTSELEGAALDWAVAKCEAHPNISGLHPDGGVRIISGTRFNPSGLWSDGGPIIEREEIAVVYRAGGYWLAYTPESKPSADGTGPIPLIAAMRCYVASELGDEVDVPEELL